MIGMNGCKWCKGTGFIYRNVDTGAPFVCPHCLPNYSWQTTRELEASRNGKLEELRKLPLVYLD